MPQTMHSVAVSSVAAGPLRRLPPPRAIAWAAAGFSGVALAAAALLAYRAQVSASSADANGAVSYGIVASAPAMVRQMTIGNNGIVYLQNATLVSIAGDTATIESAWGAAGFVWRGEITDATKIMHDDGSPAALSSFSAGQMVTVTGQIDTTSVEPAIRVQFLRE